MEEQKQGSSAMLWVVAIVVVALLAFGGYKYMNKSSSTPVEVPVTNNVDTTPVTQTTSSVYKDGTYSATGTYMSPVGNENLPVTLVLKGDVVTDATVTVGATKKESVNWQNAFISGYKTQVVGKKISEISLSKVSGSSLTPKGFMDAIAKIETQAKA
jgi:uncharacterized protein with FMN-binding domain